MEVASENQLAYSFKSHSMCVLACVCVCADIGTLLCSCQNLTGMQNIKGNREGKGKRWNGIEFNVPQQSIDFPGNKGKIQRGQSIIQGCPISL